MNRHAFCPLNPLESKVDLLCGKCFSVVPASGVSGSGSLAHSLMVQPGGGVPSVPSAFGPAISSNLALSPAVFRSQLKPGAAGREESPPCPRSCSSPCRSCHHLPPLSFRKFKSTPELLTHPRHAPETLEEPVESNTQRCGASQHQAGGLHSLSSEVRGDIDGKGRTLHYAVVF
eukprot:2008545-Rhodomonas_salina.1